MVIFKGKIRQKKNDGTYDYLLPETTIDQVNGLQDKLSRGTITTAAQIPTDLSEFGYLTITNDTHPTIPSVTSENFTLYRVTEDKQNVVEQLPKTVSSQVYDADSGKFLDETLNDLKKPRFLTRDITDLPLLELGEPAITSDTKQVFIGTGTDNLELITDYTLQPTTEAVNQLKADVSEVQTTTMHTNLAVEDMQTSVDTIEASVSRMEASFSEINNTFIEIDNTFIEIDNTFIEVDSSFAYLENMLENAGVVLANTEAYLVEEVTPAITRLSEDMADTQVQLTGVINAMEYDLIPSTTQGNSATLQALINSVRDDFIASGLTAQPVVHLAPGVYILDAEVVMSPYLKFKTLGTVIFKITHNGTGIHIRASSDDPLYSATGTAEPYLKNRFWNRGKYFEGNFIFSGATELPYEAETTNTVAVEIGGRTEGEGGSHTISDYTIGQVNVFNVSVAFKLNTFHHYNGTFEECYIDQVKHAFVHGATNTDELFSGEKFLVKNCLIRRASKSAIEIHAEIATFTVSDSDMHDCAGPLFNVTFAESTVRIVNSHIKNIEGSTPLLFRARPQSESSSYGRSTLLMDNVRIAVREQGKLIENSRNTSFNGYMYLTVDMDGVQLHLTDAVVPLPLTKAFLFDGNDPGITINNKDLVSEESFQYMMVTPDMDISCNGDFSKSVIGTVLNTTNDTYWEVTDNGTDVMGTVTADGVGGSKAISFTMPDSTIMRHIQLKAKHKLPGYAGQTVVIMPAIKSQIMDNAFTAECIIDCYDASGELVGEVNPYYAYYVANSGTVALTDYHVPRLIPRVRLPKNTVSFVPRIAFVTTAGSATTAYTLDRIFIGILGS